MMKPSVETAALVMAALCLAPCSLLANAPVARCVPTQHIQLKSGDSFVETWSGASPSIRAMTLPNGFKIGVKIEQASREVHDGWAKRMKTGTSPEFVRISLYDMTAPKPRLMTYTFGGATGKQGYGPRGGADRVDEVGDAGILFTLRKENCTGVEKPAELDAAEIAKLPTAAALKQLDQKIEPSSDETRGRDAALVEAKSGKLVLVYPDNGAPAAIIGVLKREAEKVGVGFMLEGEFAKEMSRAYRRGYMMGMMDAIYAKLGRAKMEEMEAKVKAGVAAL